MRRQLGKIENASSKRKAISRLGNMKEEKVEISEKNEKKNDGFINLVKALNREVEKN